MGFVKRARGFSSFLFWSLGWGFVSERFLFRAGAELPLADLLCAHGDPVLDDFFESEEERARPIYLTGSVQLTQGRAGRAPFQKLFSWVLLLNALRVFSGPGGRVR